MLPETRVYGPSCYTSLRGSRMPEQRFAKRFSVSVRSSGPKPFGGARREPKPLMKTGAACLGVAYDNIIGNSDGRDIEAAGVRLRDIGAHRSFEGRRG